MLELAAEVVLSQKKDHSPAPKNQACTHAASGSMQQQCPDRAWVRTVVCRKNTQVQVTIMKAEDGRTLPALRQPPKAKLPPNTIVEQRPRIKQWRENPAAAAAGSQTPVHQAASSGAAVAATALGAEPHPQAPTRYKVVFKRVAIRAEPSRDAPIVGSHRAGDEVQSCEQRANWIRLLPVCRLALLLLALSQAVSQAYSARVSLHYCA